MGAPKATATPLAALALRISLRLPSLSLYLENIRQAMLPMQVAICTWRNWSAIYLHGVGSSYIWSFFTETEARCYAQYQGNGLDYQCT